MTSKWNHATLSTCLQIFWQNKGLLLTIQRGEILMIRQSESSNWPVYESLQPASEHGADLWAPVCDGLLENETEVWGTWRLRHCEALATQPALTRINPIIAKTSGSNKGHSYLPDLLQREHLLLHGAGLPSLLQLPVRLKPGHQDPVLTDQARHLQ